MSKLNWRNRAYAVLILCATTAISLSAQTLTTIHDFKWAKGGAVPNTALVQANNGDLYGTTGGGGGTFFKITPSGTLALLYSFCSQPNCTDGGAPNGALVQANNGSLYGTTKEGGANNVGTVFSITPIGTLTTLHSFDSTEGYEPAAGLVQAADGNLYGTTEYGGAKGDGTVFSISLSGTLTTLYSFCSQSDCKDGAEPIAGLIQATNGDFYGTTQDGGAKGGYGTIFRITSQGVLTTLYKFCSQGGDCTDGAFPNAALVQGTDGNFYGTTITGGVNDDGSVFKITPTGTLTTLYSFCSQASCTDGENPYSALVEGTDGNFYGTTDQGGNGFGTVFSITSSGTLTTVYSFCSQSGCPDGKYPYAGLVQDTNGNFYGSTNDGGVITSGCDEEGCGTIFSLSVGLGPFVETRPSAGTVGKAVRILGTNLTGATNVTFNGTAATFIVVSSSEISTTVPTGATTGTVQVVTPGGTLSSNVNFQVKP
jgi:uncharacterized repeat protein (TIGR03803 family)